MTYEEYTDYVDQFREYVENHKSKIIKDLGIKDIFSIIAVSKDRIGHDCFFTFVVTAPFGIDSIGEQVISQILHKHNTLAYINNICRASNIPFVLGDTLIPTQGLRIGNYTWGDGLLYFYLSYSPFVDITTPGIRDTLVNL